MPPQETEIPPSNAMMNPLLLAWQWSLSKANAWFVSNGPYRQGVVYVPSTASNQFEMWMDPVDWTTIEKELNWAQQLGFNSVRVFLHDQMYTKEKHHFLYKVDRFLDLCESLQIKPVLVLFDSCWDPSPSYGAQLHPIPHVYSSRWVQSPGKSLLQNETGQLLYLKPYVTAITSTFGNDDRVLMLDLWNDPFQTNRMLDFVTRGSDSIELVPFHKRILVSSLLRKAFRWARSVGQLNVPLTVGLRGGTERGDSLDVPDQTDWKFIVEHSDVISFHSLHGELDVLAQVDALSIHGRPVILTEFLARDQNSTLYPLLGELYERNVWAFSKGLVEGKTQWKYPLDSWEDVYDEEPNVWSQDLLRSDGTPIFPQERDYLLQYQSQSTFDFEPFVPIQQQQQQQPMLPGFLSSIKVKEADGSTNIILIVSVALATACFILLSLLLLLRVDKIREKRAQVSPEDGEDQEKELSTRSDEDVLSPIVATCVASYPRGIPPRRQLAKTVLPSFPTLDSAIPTTVDCRPALVDISSPTCAPIDHNQIRDFIKDDFGPELHKLGIGKGNRVAVVMPDGPELALAILAIATWATVVPLEANDELEINLRRCRVDLVVGKATSGPFSEPPDEMPHNPFHVDSGTSKQELVDFMFGEVPKIADKVRLPYVELLASKYETGMFRIVRPERKGAVAGMIGGTPLSSRPNKHNDEALVVIHNHQLKVFRLRDILLDVVTISLKWNLTSRQTCFTLAPLSDAEPVICQVFAPILSGGCLIASRDTNISVEVFWTLLGQRPTFTWYYATPRTHELLLQSAPRLGWSFSWRRPWSGWNRREKKQVRIGLTRIVSDEVQRQTRKVLSATFLSYIQVQPDSQSKRLSPSLSDSSMGELELDDSDF